MTLKQIKRLVESKAGVDLSSKSRRTKHVFARLVYFYIAKNHTSYSSQDIGSEVNRDHSTVHYAMSKFYEIEQNKSVKKLLDECMEVIRLHATPSDSIKEKYLNNRLLEIVSGLTNQNILESI